MTAVGWSYIGELIVVDVTNLSDMLYRCTILTGDLYFEERFRCMLGRGEGEEGNCFFLNLKLFNVELLQHSESS